MKEIKSVLLDSSFCIRLLKPDDDFHQNVQDYFEYFSAHQIEMVLSSIVVSEYAAGDDPDSLLKLGNFRLLEFDYKDAKTSGGFFAKLKGDKGLREYEPRKVIINDLKLLGQIHNREIDAFITKDKKLLKTMITPFEKIYRSKI